MKKRGFNRLMSVVLKDAAMSFTCSAAGLPGCDKSNNSCSVKIYCCKNTGKVIEYTINYLTSIKGVKHEEEKVTINQNHNSVTKQGRNAPGNGRNYRSSFMRVRRYEILYFFTTVLHTPRENDR